MNIAIIVGLFVVIGVPGCIGLTPVEFAIKCIEEYKTVLKNYNSEEGTCTRWQVIAYYYCCTYRKEKIKILVRFTTDVSRCSFFA